MTVTLRRWVRPIGTLLLGLALLLTPIMGRKASAQPPPEPPAPEQETGTGRPFDGYVATLALVLLAFFLVGKSARR
jgi:hypothetical protein